MIDDKLLGFSKYVVPIYIRENGVLKHEGTGFLVNSGENDYLISAAHIFRQCVKKELLFITGNGKGCLIQFNAMIINRETENDLYDIGVMGLLNNKPPYKAVGKESINICKLLPNCKPKWAKEFGVIGFPETKSYSNNVDKSVSVKLYRYRANSVGEEQYKNVGITSEHHIALHFDRKKCINEDGIASIFPKPIGLSGAPIVLLHDNSNPDQDQEPYIVGVATTYKGKEKLIYGADISIAIHFIKELDEEIRMKKVGRIENT
jgi:hypothetical protein